jgi:hypothetical protein
MDSPCVQTITNVNPGCGIDTTAEWELVLEFDDTGNNPFVSGPADLATVRQGWVQSLGRTNVRNSKIRRVGS